MALVPKTVCDTPVGKVINLNGKKLGGVQTFGVEYNVDNLQTRIKLEMLIKRNSLKIKTNRDGSQTISFKSVNEK